MWLFGQFVGILVQPTPLKAVQLGDITAESLEGDRIARLPAVDTGVLFDEIRREW